MHLNFATTAMNMTMTIAIIPTVPCQGGYADIIRVCYNGVRRCLVCRSRSQRFGARTLFGRLEIKADRTSRWCGDEMMLSQLASTIRSVMKYGLGHMNAGMLECWHR